MRTIGGFWITASTSGRRYLNGNIEIGGVKHKACLLKNEFKDEGTNRPDYVLMLKDEREPRLPYRDE